MPSISPWQVFTMEDRHFLRVLIVSGFVVAALMLAARSNLRGDWLALLNSLGKFKKEFAGGVKQEQRRRPLSTAIAETQLALYVGEPFKNFDRLEWQEFWDIVYGRRYMDNPRGRNWPKVYRQLTIEEIRIKLVDMYTFPFARFSDEQWGVFFGVALKSK